MFPSFRKQKAFSTLKDYKNKTTVFRWVQGSGNVVLSIFYLVENISTDTRPEQMTNLSELKLLNQLRCKVVDVWHAWTTVWPDHCNKNGTVASLLYISFLKAKHRRSRGKSWGVTLNNFKQWRKRKMNEIQKWVKTNLLQLEVFLFVSYEILLDENVVTFTIMFGWTRNKWEGDIQSDGQQNKQEITVPRRWQHLLKQHQKIHIYLLEGKNKS